MGNFKPEIWCGIGAIVLGLSLPAIANASVSDVTSAYQHMMERLDTNHDGKISPAEWKAATDQRFAKMDTNGDGFVSQDEMTAAQEARAAARRKKHDEAMFTRADTNKDGKLSKGEYEVASQKMYERMMSHKGQGAGGVAHGVTGEAPPPDQE